MSCVVEFTMGAFSVDGDLFMYVADRQGQVGGRVLTDDEKDAVALSSAKPAFMARTSYCPMGSATNSYLPA